MSYEHGTPFLNLPQTTGDDKRDWFDTNAAFLELDSKLKAAYEGSIDTADALAALTEVVSGISTNVETLDGTVSEHTTSISTINEALTLINSALASLNTSVQGKFDSAGIADPYDAEHGIYDVGDVVTYSGQRYECVTAVTAAEPFDADKWNAVDIQTKLDTINTALSNETINWNSEGIYPLNDLYKYTYEGYISNYTADGGKYYKDVTFAHEYEKKPMISFYTTGDTATVDTAITAVSTTGCRVWVSANTANVIMHLDAIGVLKQ